MSQCKLDSLPMKVLSTLISHQCWLIVCVLCFVFFFNLIQVENKVYEYFLLSHKPVKWIEGGTSIYLAFTSLQFVRNGAGLYYKTLLCSKEKCQMSIYLQLSDFCLKSLIGNRLASMQFVLSHCINMHREKCSPKADQGCSAVTFASLLCVCVFLKKLS